MIDDKYRIGNFINQLRKEKNMTQSELGKIIGVTNKAVSKWEVGENSPDSSLFPIIAKVLGVSVDELYRGERDINIELSHMAETKYFNAVERFRRDSNIIFTTFIAYLLYLFILFMIKPIKFSDEYMEEVKKIFNIFIPIFIYLISSAYYTIINIQDIVNCNISFKNKILRIILLIIFFSILIIPIYILRIIDTKRKRKTYIFYINKTTK